jgi:hypothetical protein
VNQSDREPTAIEYVEWLLKHMLRASSLEMTINTRRALPGSDAVGSDGAPPCLPNVETVINRLKVLSGLSPVRYAQPIEARFERPSDGYVLLVATRFLDENTGSTCAIRLRIRAKKA